MRRTTGPGKSRASNIRAIFKPKLSLLEQLGEVSNSHNIVENEEQPWTVNHEQTNAQV
jgi:hypothetical protein